MSESARTLFKARAMRWLHIKTGDTEGAEWWNDRARNIAAALISTHAR